MVKLPFTECPIPLEDFHWITYIKKLEDFRDKKDNSWEYGITWEDLHIHYKDEVHAIVSEYWDSLSAEEQYQIIEKEKDGLSYRINNLNYALNKIDNK